MFGYIRPFKPELRIREYEGYKAVYCGLCRQLGRSFGPAARLALSYDFTFLSMLCYAVGESAPEFELHRCAVNPLRPVKACRRDDTLAFSADVAAITLYYKLLDNIGDETAFRRFFWKVLRPPAASARLKAAGRLPECDKSVSAWCEAQGELERRLCSNIDEACEPSARAMADICRGLSEDPRQRRVLERIGYLIGRYIYLCDALDDLAADIKSGGYNPFVLRYGLGGAGESELAGAREEIRGIIYLTAGEAASTYRLLETAAFGDTLENIFCLGLRAVVDEIIDRASGGNPSVR